MWLQVLLTLIIPFNINHLFAHSDVVKSIANPIIPFNINHLFADSDVVTSIANPNHSI